MDQLRKEHWDEVSVERKVMVTGSDLLMKDNCSRNLVRYMKGVNRSFGRVAHQMCLLGNAGQQVQLVQLAVRKIEVLNRMVGRNATKKHKIIMSIHDIFIFVHYILFAKGNLPERKLVLVSEKQRTWSQDDLDCSRCS